MATNFLLLLAALLGGQPAFPSNGSTANCYRIPVQTPTTDSRAGTVKERWCYQKQAGGLYIYNGDIKKLRPELALLVSADGTITHASLMADQLTIHRTHSGDFNPFSVPLSEPVGLEADLEAATEVDERSKAEVLELLRSHDGPIVSFNVIQNPAAARSAVLPWRGFWWPYKGRWLQRGPYARFDQFVSNRTGSNPGAVAWEDRYHAYKGVWWEGHCNGWAAASVLRAEPRAARFDSQSGIRFSVSDQKALLTGIDYCANVAFFGERYRGSRNNPRDIAPALFHKTLLYYIGSLRKPVAVDYRADVAVDNHVISGYTMAFQPNGANSYVVTTTLTVHKYDGSIIDIPGTAPAYTRVYRYVLNTDARNVPVGGHWLSANPDFLWVPLSPTTCRSNNQNLKREWVSTIMGLPLQ